MNLFNAMNPSASMQAYRYLPTAILVQFLLSHFQLIIRDRVPLGMTLEVFKYRSCTLILPRKLQAKRLWWNFKLSVRPNGVEK